ncbi:MAG: 5-(carboxyamino)imidazole ribonucleotide synthase [Tidjanibacter sp.]|nr:5-(carboxyamino)imidazole ribonucleotide synthase [Tidjanibacter sp.]
MAATIGIIGGGQLGLMIAEQAAELGARTIALDPSPTAPVFAVTNEHIVAAFDDREALDELCRRSDVVTYEFENVPADVLIDLERRYNIKQGTHQLFDSQDRLREKQNAQHNGLLTPRFAAVDNADSLHRAVAAIGYPCVLKTRRLGYDGHGQVILHSEVDLPKAEPLLGTPSILEEFVKFDYETSVIAVADQRHAIVFPVGQNIHRDGILDLSIVPARQMSEQLQKRIRELTVRFMKKCRYRGILAIEYFIKGEEIYFNEMAPRPHNSGHYTIEGCTTNQFRELVRYLLGLPLEEPQLKAPTVMKNILGRDLEAAKAIAAEHHDGVFVHLYGKSESRPLRKMGHITFTNLTAEQFDSQWKKRFTE